MLRTIKAKLFLVLFMMATGLLLASIGGVFALHYIAATIQQVDGTNRQLEAQALPLLQMTAEARYEVVQIQQFLSDISATRGQDGLDDGLGEAEKHANALKKDLAEIQTLAQSIGDSDLAANVQAIQKALPTYWTTGRKLAQAYIDGGPADGNKVMPEFDAQADGMDKALEAMTERAHALSDARIKDSRDAIVASADTISGIQKLGGVIAVIGLITTVIAVPVVSWGVGLFARMADVMRAISDGNLQIEIPGSGRQDEAGRMAEALRVFRDNAAMNERLRAEQEQDRTRAEQEKHSALLAMAETVERETRNAVAAVAIQTGQMHEAADRMADSARTMTGNAQGVAAAAQQALSNAQTVASASEELSASIAEIGNQVGTSTLVTQRAVQAAQDARLTIDRLSQSVVRIDEVAKLINDIASQTNLLALNATIEAARAGEAGKGFAVVAGEVKNLANQTARSTEEITRQISEIQATTGEAVTAMGMISHTISEVDTISSSIAASVQQQSAATSEIARNVTQTTLAAREVSTRIADVSSEADVTGGRAAEVSASSGNVAEAISSLREVLIRVVRTSTKDVDRRHFERSAVDWRCSLTTPAGAPTDVIEGTVFDVSEGGAAIRVGAKSFAPGSRLQLSIAGLTTAITAAVKEQDGDALHLDFLLSDAAEADRIGSALAGLLQRGSRSAA